jgi:P27 family predicted phage terminase small subunit
MPKGKKGSGGCAKAAPPKPPFLAGEGAAEWDRIVPELDESGLLTNADRAVLAAYCQAWEELVECTREIRKDGRFLAQPIQNSKGELLGEEKIIHPALKMQRDAIGRVRSLLDSLGLTPAARRRMQLTEGDKGDEFVSLLAAK